MIADCVCETRENFPDIRFIPANIALAHCPIHIRASSYSCSRSHSCWDTSAVRTHADAGYCTDCHSSSWIGNYSAAPAIVRVTPIFAGAPCTKAKLVSDDCSFELVFAFVVGPDLILAQHV